MRYRTFAPKRDEKFNRMEAAQEAARVAEAEYYKFRRETTITEEAKGFKVFVDALSSPWRVYGHDEFVMMKQYQTVEYNRSTGEWVWMIDADRPAKHGWSSVDPYEVLAVLRDYKF